MKEFVQEVKSAVGEVLRIAKSRNRDDLSRVVLPFKLWTFYSRDEKMAAKLKEL